MNKRRRALLIINGIGLLITALITGWLHFFQLLGAIELWPLIDRIDVQVPGESRAWIMAHMEGITNGLLLIAIAAAAPMLTLSPREGRWLLWSSITFGWLFTLPAIANAWFGTRGLAFGGGPFGGGLANDLVYLSGWPPILAVHIAFALLLRGAYLYYRSLAPADAP
jgi:hypothetical protein